MRAGALDRRIEIQAASESKDEFGVITEAWQTVATVRAQIIQSATAEYLAGAGEAGEAVLIFRARWLDGLSVRNRVIYNGQAYDVREIKEIGRRKGVDIRCQARQ